MFMRGNEHVWGAPHAAPVAASAKRAYDRVVSWTVLLCVVALVIYSVAFMESGLSGLGYAAMLLVVVTRLRDLRQR